MAYITGTGPNSRTTLVEIRSGSRSWEVDTETRYHSEIKGLQVKLAAKGYSTGGIDGIYGNATANAVRSIQSAWGLTSDGYYGRMTNQQLESRWGAIVDQGPPEGGGTGTNPDAYGTVFGGRLYCRKSPSTSADYWGLFENGASIPIWNYNSTWHRTIWNNDSSKVGYVMASYVDTSGGGPSPGGTIHKGNRYLSETEMRDNARYILNYLRGYGWTTNAICGMLGNMEAESTINPGLWEGRNSSNPNKGYGLVQWTPSTKYTDWARNNGYANDSMDGQLQRILYEVTRSGLQWVPTSRYPMSFSEFTRSTDSAYNLAVVFLRNYERPASPNDADRGNKGSKWYNYLA